MRINWKVRFRNKLFIVEFTSAVLVAIQALCAIFGLRIDLSDLSGKIMAAVNAVLVPLALLGIINDPTTDGHGDSEQALTYEEPKK